MRYQRICMSVMVLLGTLLGYASGSQELAVEQCSNSCTFLLAEWDVLAWIDHPDSVCSPHDTKELKERLIAQMMEGFGQNGSEDYYYPFLDSRGNYSARLVRVFEFAEDPDFVLLMYCVHQRPDQVHSLPYHMRYVYAGLVKSTNGLYLLSDGYGSPSEDRLNQMIEENGGVPRLSPLCKAALAIRLRSEIRMMAIIESWSDVKLLLHVHFDLYEPDLPDRWRNRDPFFFFFPSRDTVLVAALGLSPDGQPRSASPSFASSGIASEIADSMQVSPVSIRANGDTTFIAMTTYRFVASCGRISSWEVALSLSGIVLSVHRTDCYTFGSCVVLY